MVGHIRDRETYYAPASFLEYLGDQLLECSRRFFIGYFQGVEIDRPSHPELV